MVQSQKDLGERVEAAKPAATAFVKDRPILGWKIDVTTIDDLPSFIREHLGSVDETGYDADYLERNMGSIIALQMNDDGPDFYIIGKSTYENSYEEVPVAEVAEKNGELVEQLNGLPDLRDRIRRADPNLVGARKTEPVDMIAMSDIGYDVGDEVSISASWGTQTKPAGQDAFLVVDESKDQYYLINVDERGLPMGYVRAP